MTEIGRVHQHDFDHAGAEALIGTPLPGGPIELPTDSGGARLATGDRLIVDPDERARLAADADLVDMEGYAIAATCREFGVPVRLVKAVSDSADADAVMTWRDALDRCSTRLAAWADAAGLVG